MYQDRECQHQAVCPMQRVYIHFLPALSNSITSGHIQSTAPGTPFSLNETLIQWLGEFEKRQAHRDAMLYKRLDHMEKNLALALSRRLDDGHQPAEILTESNQQSIEDDCTQADGPSAQSLIERGVLDGWSDYVAQNGR